MVKPYTLPKDDTRTGSIDYNWYFDDESDDYHRLSLQWIYCPAEKGNSTSPSFPESVELWAVLVPKMSAKADGWLGRIFMAMYEDPTDHTFRDEIDSLIWKEYRTKSQTYDRERAF